MGANSSVFELEWKKVDASEEGVSTHKARDELGEVEVSDVF